MRTSDSDLGRQDMQQFFDPVVNDIIALVKEQVEHTRDEHKCGIQVL